MNEHELTEAIRIRDVVREHGNQFHARGTIDLVRELDVAEVFAPRSIDEHREGEQPNAVDTLTDASDIFGDDVPAWMRDATVTIDVDASEARRSTATGASMETSPISSQLEPALTRVELLAAALAGLVLGAVLSLGGLALVNAIADAVEQGQP